MRGGVPRTYAEFLVNNFYNPSRYFPDAKNFPVAKCVASGAGDSTRPHLQVPMYSVAGNHDVGDKLMNLCARNWAANQIDFARLVATNPAADHDHSWQQPWHPLWQFPALNYKIVRQLAVEGGKKMELYFLDSSCAKGGYGKSGRTWDLLEKCGLYFDWLAYELTLSGQAECGADSASEKTARGVITHHTAIMKGERARRGELAGAFDDYYVVTEEKGFPYATWKDTWQILEHLNGAGKEPFVWTTHSMGITVAGDDEFGTGRAVRRGEGLGATLASYGVNFYIAGHDHANGMNVMRLRTAINSFWRDGGPMCAGGGAPQTKLPRLAEPGGNLDGVGVWSCCVRGWSFIS